jgi:hypothetical protein
VVESGGRHDPAFTVEVRSAANAPPDQQQVKRAAEQAAAAFLMSELHS